jgi:hypothetical protein
MHDLGISGLHIFMPTAVFEPESLVTVPAVKYTALAGRIRIIRYGSLLQLGLFIPISML